MSSGEKIDIFPDDLSKLMQEGKAILFDVRAGDQFEKEHIDGATANAADSDLNINWPQEAEAQGKIICVHCNGGGRSGRVSNKYAAEGKTIYNLAGGIKAWKMAGLKTISK